MSDCLSANESSLQLSGEHRLRAALAQTLVCTAPTCPTQVREACRHRVDDLNRAIPTIVFFAKDSAGNDLTQVHVFMDGEPISDRLDGTALSIDPGRHAFTFEVAGAPPTRQSFLVGEGQKDRPETITIAAGASVPTLPLLRSPALPLLNPTETQGSATSSGLATERVVGLALGGVGVVGLGIGAVFGLLARSAWSNAKNACAGNTSSCPDPEVATANSYRNSTLTDATISTADFIGGGLLIAAGAVVFFVGGHRERNAPVAVRLVPCVGPDSAGVSLHGAF
jgi:hypothetical protein